MADDVAVSSPVLIKNWKDIESELNRLSAQNCLIEENDAPCKNILKICYAVLQRKVDILQFELTEEDEQYFSKLLVLLSFVIVQKIDNLEKHADVVSKIIVVILQFVGSRILEKRSHLFYTRNDIIKVIQSLCELTQYFQQADIDGINKREVVLPGSLADVLLPDKVEGDDFEVFLQAFQENHNNHSGARSRVVLDGNPTWKAKICKTALSTMYTICEKVEFVDALLSSDILLTMTNNYAEVYEHGKDDVTVEPKCFQQLTDELGMIKELYNLSIIAPSSIAMALKLTSLVEFCLKSALFVASGQYTVGAVEPASSSTSSLSTGSADWNCEDHCRKHGLKATEESLAIFVSTCNVLENSSRHTLSQNTKINCSIVILKSLLRAMDVNREKKNPWKWFDGVNIMFVTMISRVMTILAAVIDEAKDEGKISTVPSKRSAETPETFDVLKSYKASQRLHILMSTLSAPQLFVDLFFFTYEKGLDISNAANMIENEGGEQAQSNSSTSLDSGKKSDSQAGSDEDLSNEEGSMLGDFFVQTITNGGIEPNEEETSSQTKLKEDAFAQSGEVFLLLASSLLEFANKYFDICVYSGLSGYLTDALSGERLEKLAKILISNVADKEDILKNTTQFLITVVKNRFLDDSQLDSLLSVWNISSHQKSQWPVTLKNLVLSIFTRVALAECLDEGKENSYVHHSWSSFLTSLQNAIMDEESEEGTNVEYLQVMILLFHLLDKRKKVELFEKCQNIIADICRGGAAIKSPVHVSRLLLLYDYLLCNMFSDDGKSLVAKQVHENVLTDITTKENPPVHFSSIFREDDMLKKVSFKVNNLADDRSPYFFLLSNELRRPDSEALQLLCNPTGTTYKYFYDSFLTLLNNVLTELKNNSNHTDVLKVVAFRSSFLQMWNLLRQLPVPAEHLISTHKLVTASHVESSPEECLFYLCWIPLLYESSKEEDINKIVKVIYPSGTSAHQSSDSKTTVEIITSLPKIIHDPAAVISYGQKLVDFCQWIMERDGPGSLIFYMIADGMAMYMWLLFKKYVIEQKDHMHNVAALKQFFMSVVRLLQKAVVESKKMIIRWASGDEVLLAEKMSFYVDVLGVDLPEVSGGGMENMPTNEGNGSVLPANFQQALRRWNHLECEKSMNLVPKLLQNLEVSSSGAQNIHISTVIGLCIGSVVTSHVDFTSTEPPFVSGGASLKRYICTLANISQGLLEWMPLNFSEEFDHVKEACASISFDLWTDHAAAHISPQIEALALLCVDDPASRDRFEMHFSKMIGVIDKWMMIDFEKGGVAEESILISWLKFLSKLMDHTKTLDIFTSYYDEHARSLSAILTSVVNGSDRYTSDEYCAVYIVFCTKLISLGDQSMKSNIRDALIGFIGGGKQQEDIQTVDINTQLTGWIQFLVFSTKYSMEGCLLVQLAANFGVQNVANGCNMEVFLACELNVMTSYACVVKSTEAEIAVPDCFPFINFFGTIISIASSMGGNGHCKLFESVLALLKQNAEVWSKAFQTATLSKSSNRIRECYNTLVLYVTKIMSALNRVKEHNIGDVDNQGFTSPSQDLFGMVDFSTVGGVSANAEDDVSPNESDEEGLTNKICTFTITKHDFMNQHWYHCHTCKMSDSVGCCTVCAKICHKGHDVTYSKHGSFFCDCGAKEDGSCMAMPKAAGSSSVTSMGDKQTKTVSPFAAWGDSTSASTPASGSSKKKKSKSKIKVAASGTVSNTKGNNRSPKSTKSDKDLVVFERIVKESETELNNLVQMSGIFEFLCDMLVHADTSFTDEIAQSKKRANELEEELKQRMKALYEDDKECMLTDNLMVAISGSQEGAFEGVKLNYSGEQGQTIRQLMLAHVIYYKAMCLIASPRGKRQQLAIAHEKGKITVLQLSGLLKQSTVKKTMTLNRLATIMMPFMVLNMTNNSMNDDYLAVTGLKDCHVVTLSHSTNATESRIVVPLKLEAGNYIIKSLWIPASAVTIALLTADFIKIYDLSKSDLAPIHHFVLPSGKVRDATFVTQGCTTRIIIMSSQGYIYTEVLSKEASSAEPFYMMNVLPVVHSTTEEADGLINGGGSSIYYSESLKLLFFSYTKGRSFIGALKDDFSGFAKVFPITSSLIASSPLVQWSEVQGQLGLMHCVHQNNNSVITIAVKTDKILLQEVKGLSKNVKVQSAVCYHQLHTPSKSRTTTLDQSTLIVLFDDGNLRIYNANQVVAEFTRTKQEISSVLLEASTPKKLPVKKDATKSTATTGPTSSSSASSVSTKVIRRQKNSSKFPVEFFERCHVANDYDVEFGGDDILHVYNKAQVKHRLNTAAMYIANTKPAGFKVDIKNTNSSNVVVGIRVQVGVQSTERAPQYLEVMGRIIQMHMAKNRWYDIPLSRDESFAISEKNEFTLAFGPSSDPYGLSIVDSIKVYVQSKEMFGFTDETVGDKTQEQPVVEQTLRPALDNPEHSNSEQLLLSTLGAVNASIGMFDVKDDTPTFKYLLDISSGLLTLEPSPNVPGNTDKLGTKGHHLMKQLYPDEEKFKNKKDEVKVSHLLQMLTNAKAVAETKHNGRLDVNAFFTLLTIARTVGITQPENFVNYITVGQNLSDFVASILEGLWNIHSQTTAKIESNQVTEKELSQLCDVVGLVVGVLFIIMLGDQTHLEPMTNHITELLLYKDRFVSFGAKQGITKALHSRQRKTNKPQSIHTSSSIEEEEEEDERGDDEDDRDNKSDLKKASEALTTSSITTGIHTADPSVSSLAITESPTTAQGGTDNTSSVSHQQQQAPLVEEAIDLIGEYEEVHHGDNEEDDDYEEMMEEDDEGMGDEQMDIENDIMNSGDLQMLLGDDNAMMEIALALSLQNQQQSQQQQQQQQQLQQQLQQGNGIVESLSAQQNAQEDGETVDDNDDHNEADNNDEEDGEDVTFPDEQPDAVQESIDDISDVGQESFSASPSFANSPNLVSRSETPTDAAFRVVRSHLLTVFHAKIKELVELDGLQAIPFLQVLLILCSNLGNSSEDIETLKSVVAACIEPLQINQLGGETVAVRSKQSEVQLVLMRFLSVLMSRCTSTANAPATTATTTALAPVSLTKVFEESPEAETMEKTFDANVAGMLCEHHLVDHCLFLLKNLQSYWQDTKNAEDEGSTGNESSNLLKTKSIHPTPDMMPFFMEQYVKSHALDLFEAFPQLVTEMTLRVPYQIHKLLDTQQADENLFDKDWTFVLCEYMLMPHTPFVRRQVRKLLLALCGSKEKYRFVKDLHNLRSHLSGLRELFHQAEIVIDDVSGRTVSLSYENIVTVTESISACIDIASSRNENWKSFCRKEKAILPFLIQASYQVTEHISSKIIELVSLALIAPKKRDKQEKKEKANKIPPAKDNSPELIRHVFAHCTGTILTSFIRHFLLESNSSPLRWKVHELIQTMYLNIECEQQVVLIDHLWTLWDTVPNYGHRAVQFVDLAGYFTIKTSHPSLKNMIDQFTSKTLSMLKEGNKMLKDHPNSNLYRKLNNYVELDGFYLESDPCLICNNPELSFNTFKLSSIKSDIRYTTKAQVIKLTGNYYISKINLKITDVKKAKMVKTINVFYSNKTVPSAVELKNKTGIWQRAKKITLTQAQTEIKVDLTFPITACNLMIEFVEFFDNAQFSSETLQCPRCSANVPSHPGVCSNCGENVYQCHKCRAINYDERDPFLCTSCGFCKYGKFEFTFSAHACCSVESINNEEERQKALKSVNTTLERADLYYQQLSTHRQALETLFKTANQQTTGASQDPMKSTVWNISALANGSTLSSSSSGGASTVAMTSINQFIQAIAQRYCVDCKNAFKEMSKVTQSVTATRRELVQYDVKQRETLSQALYASPTASPSVSGNPPSFCRLASGTSILSSNDDANNKSAVISSRCYGCTLQTINHCLTILRALVTITSTHDLMLKEGLLQELVEHNLQQQSTGVVSLAQTLLIKLTSDNKSANSELNEIIRDRIKLCLATKSSNMSSDISLHSELSVMQNSIASGDCLWEERIRCVFKLFINSLQHTSPEVVESVTLPCLQIINNSLIGFSQKDNKKTISVNKSQQEIPGVSTSGWLSEAITDSFDVWKEKRNSENKEEVADREFYLMKKYGSVWLQKCGKVSGIVDTGQSQPVDVHPSSGWLKLLLFAPSSRQTREIVCTILENLAQNGNKRKTILHMLMSYLSEFHTAGENAAEYLNLLKNLSKKSSWKVYMCNFGILDSFAQLLIKEVDHLTYLEGSTLNFDLAQGYALNALTELLKSFLDDNEVKVKYRGRFVAEVLQCYLSLRRLVVQRTKLVDETQEMLSTLLQQITSGTEQSAFMKTLTDTLKRCPVKDLRTPAFVFEQLCDVIHKEEEEASEFFMFLEKDLQQEDYLQGRMQGNPYSSKEVGLGPLMRDVKNKICTECELVALLEDDTGMELLVNNKIISLDLPVEQVYKKIWCSNASSTESKDPMKVVYRMRGLLGDATEDMIESLDSGKEKDVDEENEYQRASVMAENGGLDVTLKRLSFIRDLSRAQQLVSAILKLLEYCVKVKVNRQYLHKPSVNAMKILLGTLNLALRLEKDLGSSSGGATIAERVLKLMEIILHEASSEAATTEVVALPGEESQLGLLLNHITSPYVRSNANVLEAMMRLTPFLTFGRNEAMGALIDHFLPFFDFDSFDKDKSPDAVLHLDCFSMIASGISMSASGSKLKDMINNRGMVKSILNYLHSHTPPKSLRASGILDTAKWKEFLTKPSLPYILRILTGLINGHPGTQALLAIDENVAMLHHLEQVSTEEMVGSLAENLMEALGKFPEGKQKVSEVRKRTRDEKKQMAMAMRQKQLESLGMMITTSGQIKAKPATVSKEMEKLIDEKDQRLVCCICREGYTFYPNKVLGIYTFTLRCILDEFENKPKRTQGYSTVSHFNVIHYDCHIEAVRHARSRDEWESAALQNGNTKCNGLLPIWGPKVSESSFAACLARHHNYIQEYTGFREPTFHSSLHDVRLLLLRFAQEKPFHRDAGGGGKLSNMFLLPYMINVAFFYILNSTRQRSSEEQLLKVFLDSKPDSWITSCYEVNGPLFAAVLSIFVMSLEEWKEKKLFFLRRLVLLAHVRSISPVPMNKLVTCDTKPYETYKPVLMFFYLIDQLNILCKEKLSTDETWPVAMSNFLRNNDDLIMKEAEKILKTFEEELLPCESFAEFCDVSGLLGVLSDPECFVNELLKPYGVEGTEVFC